MEAARAYHRLLNEFEFSQDTIAQRTGKDRSTIANMVRLVNLPYEIQRLLESFQLSTGHAKVILGVGRPEAQLRLARLIVQGQLSVRQAEKLAATEVGPLKARHRSRPSPLYPDLTQKLQKRLGTRVGIQKSRKGGKIIIQYFSVADLDRLVELLLG